MTNTAALANSGNRRYPGRRISPEGPVSGDGRSRSTSLEDATSHHPHTEAATGQEAGHQSSPAPAASGLEPILAQFAELLAEALAPRLAAQLATQAATAAEGPPSRRLLTLDELVAQLPAGKKPATWKRWLYERTRRDHLPGQEVPGARKIGGRWFFVAEQTIAWLTGTDLDLAAEQSLDQPPMEPKTKPAHPRGGS